MKSSVVRQICFNLENVFSEACGIRRVSQLLQSVAPAPTLAVGGDQLTGKSTLAKRLARRLNVEMWSVGSAFRAAAEARGMSPGVFAAAMLKGEEPGIDIELDLQTCERIAQVGGVVEGRQPAFMAMWLREAGVLSSFGAVSVLVRCDDRERVLRFLEREVGPEAVAIANEQLPQGEEGWTMQTFAPLVQTLPLDAAMLKAFAENVQRDEDDAARYMDLYGIDYRDPGAYDLVVDTSGRSADENEARTLKALAELAPAGFDGKAFDQSV